jgi:TRAP-type C4-dicarboxylate transport system permease small subunit
MERLIVAYERGYRAIATYLVFLPLLAMTLIEFLNAVGRKLFIPFPGTIESVESLLVVSVYFGVALVALEGGHVNVTVATERLPPGARHGLDAVANLLAALVFGFLAAGAGGEALRSIALLEYRLGVYRFPLWPFKALFALGLALLTIQLLLNTVKHLALARGRASYAGLKREESRGPVVMT